MILDCIKQYKGTCIIEESNSYSFMDLNNQIQKYSALLGRLIEKNDVVLIDSDYSFNSIALLLALSKGPNIVVPVIRTTETEFEAKIEASGANVIVQITEGDLKVSKTTIEQIDYDGYQEILSQNDAGIVLFSSGTTGTPKVMVHNLSKLIGSFVPPRRQKQLRFLLFLMFDHIGGLNTLFGCLNNGSTSIIPSDRNPDNILRIIEQKQVQILPTSPTFLNLMLMVEEFDHRDVSSLRLITYGTERMSQDLLNRLHQKLPGIKLLQTFGTSETGILKTVSKSSDSLFFKIINDDLDYRIVENQLLLKTRTTVRGYKDQESDQFLNDGWFATGDLVEQDEDGFIKIIGRINDVINVGGLKVMPIEVELVINEVDGVIDSSVYGEENALTGQMVCAKVVIAPDEDPADMKKRIKSICKSKLDKYKRPTKLMLDTKLNTTSRFKKALK